MKMNLERLLNHLRIFMIPKKLLYYQYIQDPNPMRKRETIKRIDSLKNSGSENDKDIALMLSKGKQLISYTAEE